MRCLLCPLVLGVACGGPRISDPAVTLLELLDADGSGDLSVEELASHQSELLHAELDTDGDGVLSVEEVRADLERWDRGVPKRP